MTTLYDDLELNGKTRGRKIAELRMEIADLESKLALAKELMNTLKIDYTSILVDRQGNGYDGLGKNEESRRVAVETFLNAHEPYVGQVAIILSLEGKIRLAKAALEAHLDMRREEENWAKETIATMQNATMDRLVNYLFTTGVQHGITDEAIAKAVERSIQLG